MTNVRAEILGDRIGVRAIRRFPGDYDMSKQIPGGRWNKEASAWTYPLTMASCRIVREVYTDMLTVGPELQKWFLREQRKALRARAAAGSKDQPLTRVPTVVPRVYEATASRRYQRAGIRWLADQNGGLLADEPTLGKTIQYLGAIAEAGHDHGVHLIAGPKSSLFSTWANEIHKWTDWHAFWMPEGRKRREAMLRLFMADEYEGPRFLVINFEMLQILIMDHCKKCDRWGPTRKEEKETDQWWADEHYLDGHKTKPAIRKCDWPELFEIEWQSICIDEAHMSLLGIRPGGNSTQQGEGLKRLRLSGGGMKIASTGTPMRGQALNFWSIFNWLAPSIWTSKWAYAESFLKMKTSHFTQSGKEIINEIRDDRQQALSETLSTIMLRRTKREVQPDLPEDLTLDQWVEMYDRHAKQYGDLVEEGELEITNGTISTQGALAEYTRRKQFAWGCWMFKNGELVPEKGTSAKMDWIFEFLKKRGVTGNPKTEFFPDGGGIKYIIASQFTTLLDSIAREIEEAGIKTLMITGAVSGKKRDAAVASFQKDAYGPRVLLVNTMAGGTSLTLDAMCDEMIIIDETWVSDDQFQLEGRIRNRDVEKRVAVRSYHYLRTRGTLEEEIADSGLTQDEFQKTILDRSRGVRINRRSIKR